jgi:hypothetical protein
MSELTAAELKEFRALLVERESARRAALSPVERATEDLSTDDPDTIAVLVRAICDEHDERRRQRRIEALVPLALGGGIVALYVAGLVAAIRAPRTRRGAIARAAIRWLTR